MGEICAFFLSNSEMNSVFNNFEKLTIFISVFLNM